MSIVRDIEYLKGDATAPIGPGPKVIAHICNDIGAWGAGFVLAISSKWKQPERQYRKWHKTGDDFLLGMVQYVKVSQDTWVANMIAQHGLRSPLNRIPLRYNYLDDCLKDVAKFCIENNASFHEPRFGAGLGGGDWNIIEKLIHSRIVAQNIKATIYDF